MLATTPYTITLPIIHPCVKATQEKNIATANTLYSLLCKVVVICISLASNFSKVVWSSWVSINKFFCNFNSLNHQLCVDEHVLIKKLTRGVTQIGFTHCKLERDFSAIAVVMGNMKYNRNSLLTSQNIIWWYLTTSSWHLILVTFLIVPLNAVLIMSDNVSNWTFKLSTLHQFYFFCNHSLILVYLMVHYLL